MKVDTSNLQVLINGSYKNCEQIESFSTTIHFNTSQNLAVFLRILKSIKIKRNNGTKWVIPTMYQGIPKSLVLNLCYKRRQVQKFYKSLCNTQKILRTEAVSQICSAKWTLFTQCLLQQKNHFFIKAILQNSCYQLFQNEDLDMLRKLVDCSLYDEVGLNNILKSMKIV